MAGQSVVEEGLNRQVGRCLTAKGGEEEANINVLCCQQNPAWSLTVRPLVATQYTQSGTDNGLFGGF